MTNRERLQWVVVGFCLVVALIGIAITLYGVSLVSGVDPGTIALRYTVTGTLLVAVGNSLATIAGKVLG